MRIKVSNQLYVTNPTPELAAWCKKNLVLPNPDYAKKQRMGFWVGNTPKELCLYEVHGNDLVLPYGVIEKIPIDENTRFECEWGGLKFCDYHRYSRDIPLYHYQHIAVNKMRDSYHGILQAPAGSGKTQMGLAIIQRCMSNALWLTHTHDLLQQSKSRAEQYFDPDIIGTITEGKVDIGTGITFATIQTMCKLDLDALKYMWDIVIVDECHRVAGTPTGVTMFSKVLNHLAAPRKYGLSATVHRADGLIKATYALLGEVAYTVPREAVAERVMPVTVIPVPTGVRISDECLNTDGTLNYAGMINYCTTNYLRNVQIASAIVTDAQHPSLILSDRLAHLETLMSMLPGDLRDDAVMISGRMTSKKGKAEREQAIEDMRSGKKKYLFATYALAKEGLDIPCLERLYMATPQKDRAVVEQAVGRIARTCEGKADPICYDFVDEIGYLQKAWRTRKGIYKKCGCTVKE